MLLQKPFGSPIVHLLGISVVMFNFHSLATFFTYDFESKIPIKMWKDVVLKGFISALKNVDAATDLEMGYFVLARAASNHCMWLDGHQNCSSVHSLGIGMLSLAAVDLASAVLHLFLSKRYSDGDRKLFWPGVAVHTISLFCELGILAGSIIEGRVSLLVGAQSNQTQSIGLTPREQTAYITMSILLTVSSFIVGLFGVRRLFEAVRRTSVVLAQHVSRCSCEGTKSSAGTESSPCDASPHGADSSSDVRHC
jgi:hypothetical protein